MTSEPDKREIVGQIVDAFEIGEPMRSFLVTQATECQATRYGTRRECEVAAAFDVVYRGATGDVIDRHAACFRHGLAEVDAHSAAAGMARVDLVPFAKQES